MEFTITKRELDILLLLLETALDMGDIQDEYKDIIVKAHEIEDLTRKLMKIEDTVDCSTSK